MSAIIFDIETGALPEDQIAPLLNSVTPETVKTGNLKDPAKIAAKVEEKRQKLMEDAALSATTGRVVAIGYLIGSSGETKLTPHEWDERQILTNFWEHFAYCRRQRVKLIGFNCFNFDLPFLLRRSWVMKVFVPDDACERRGWPEFIIDLARVWGCGVYGEYASLNEICVSMGLGEKNGKATDFARLWLSNNPEDQAQASAYLKNDLAMTHQLAERMAVLDE